MQAMQSYLDSIHGANPDAMNIPFIANHDTDRAAGYLTRVAAETGRPMRCFGSSPFRPIRS